MYQMFLNFFVDDFKKWKSGPDFKHIKSSVFFKVRCPVFQESEVQFFKC